MFGFVGRVCPSFQTVNFDLELPLLAPLQISNLQDLRWVQKEHSH